MRIDSDAIRGELLRSQLSAVVADMGQTLSRCAVSLEITDERDFSNGIVLEHGEVVVMDNGLHLGPMSATSLVIQDEFQFAMKQGDVVLTNDPYSGGNHVQDFTVIAPFYYNRDHLCYLVCRAHLPDIGGHVAGGYYPFADDIWGEGSRITPVKIFKEGKMVRDVLDAVLINGRYPETFRLNLEGMLAALEVGNRRLSEIVGEYGKEALLSGMKYCLQYSESQLITEIRKWPNGTFEGESVLDHDGRGGTGLKVAVRLKVEDERLTLDFSSSAPQSRGFVNSTRANTVSCALVPFYTLFTDQILINSGLLRPVEILTTEGTIVDPAFPAPVGWNPFHIGSEIVAAVVQALGRVCPERIAALAPKFMMVMAQWSQEEQPPFPLHLFLQGGAGGSHGCDGWGGFPGPFARVIVPSIEIVETQKPLRVKRLEMVPDSAGDGQWRGGFGTVAEFEFTDTTLVSVVMEGSDYPSEAVEGGKDGAPNQVKIAGREFNERILWEQDLSGDTLEIMMGGGAGWGEPSARKGELIQQDLETGMISEKRVSKAG